MSSTPFMPLWVGDFMTKTIDLDTRETGAYMLLLMAMWTNGGSLPEDHKKLQRIARAGREWPKVWQAIERFFTVEDGVITQSRLVEEYKKVTAKTEVRRQSGSLGGKAKALKDKGQNVAKASDLPCQSYLEPKLEANASIDPPIEAKPKRKRVVHDDTPEFLEFWEAYPRREAKGDARAAFAKAIRKASSAVIIAAARRVEDEGKYTPHPSTWLNGERWADGPPKAKTADATPAAKAFADAVRAGSEFLIRHYERNDAVVRAAIRDHGLTPDELRRAGVSAPAGTFSLRVA